jgi:DNA-binding MarR family transcriptional regulator
MLELIVRAVGPLPQASIAFRLGRDRTTVMRVTRSLATKGLVTPLRDEEDGRVRALVPTEEGIERFRLADSNLQEAAESFFWLFSETEREALVAELLRVL